MSFAVSKMVQFPESSVQFVPVAEEFSGTPREALVSGLLPNAPYVWHARGPSLEVRNTRSGNKVGSWIFGLLAENVRASVVCVEEIGIGELPLLAVGLESAVSGGYICIFNFFWSRVVRAIQVKDKISSLHVVDSNCKTLNLPGALKSYDGVLAVGTRGGNVYLVDLCRQICIDSLHSTFVRDERNPSQLQLLTKKDAERAEFYKLLAVGDGNHLAIHLNFVPDIYTLHSAMKNPKGNVDQEKVLASALSYCSPLRSLLVGYNFGAFQLWDLTTLSLVYSSPVHEKYFPVTHFSLQETDYDPRALCYIWVVYSNLSSFQEGFPLAAMYLLSYKTKNFRLGFGHCYQDFQCCLVRLQAELGQISQRQDSKARGGHCLSMQAVSKPANKYARFPGHSFALNLITWTVWFSENDMQTFLFVFDLNQWHKEEMPGLLCWEDCSTYVLKLNFSDCLLSMTGFGSGPLLDVKMDQKTLQRFEGTQKLEEHFHPYSLTFGLRGSRESDVLCFQNKGLQTLLLAELVSEGPLSLWNPSEIYRRVLGLGLAPLFTETHPNAPATPETQREIVLSVALEHQLLGWLCRCATEWSSGSFLSVNCSLQFLLDWAFSRADALKTNCDVYSSLLFDCTHFRPDRSTQNLINTCSGQMRQLTTLLSHILEQLSDFVWDVDLVCEQRATLKALGVYYDVLQWFEHVDLLPTNPFPTLELIKFYDEKRSHLRSLNMARFGETNSVLFIDNLLEMGCGGEELAKQWRADGGSGLYPPPSLQSLLRSYLVKGAGENHQHSLVTFALLDLVATMDHSTGCPVISNLKKFPSVFKLNASAIKLTHAFWQVDHGVFAAAMNSLLDPMISTELQPWHHSIGMRSLYLQGEHTHAMLYMNVRNPPMNDQRDILTAISLFVAKKKFNEAFYFEKAHQSGNQDKLLLHLFRECDQNNCLNELLGTNFSAREERAFFKYLEEFNTPASHRLRNSYYVMKARYAKAFEKHLARNWPRNKDSVEQNNATAADQVMIPQID